MKSSLVFAVYLCLLTMVTITPTFAQEAVSQDATRTRTVKDAACMIETDNKVPVMAESSVVRFTVSIPPVGSAPLPLETRLTALVEQLPRGTQWMKLMLPRQS